MFRLSSCFALATVWVLRINELVIPNFIQENVADDEQLLVQTRENIVSLFYDCNYVYGLKYSFLLSLGMETRRIASRKMLKPFDFIMRES